jgi:xanthine dehydrogenase iron-sulfur cluster and FAD-binding subunit A
MLRLSVNGQTLECQRDPRSPLLETLREGLGLRGTKYGCGEGECGACTVIVDGKTICSCLATSGSLVGAEITTIDGLANDPVGVGLFNAFAKHGAIQCGFCTPGFVLSAWNLIAHRTDVTQDDIRDALGGNLCRCTGYTKLVHAVVDSAANAPTSPLTKRVGMGSKEVRAAETYWRPTSLQTLLGSIGSMGPGCAVVAGGTDLMVQNEHHLRELSLIDISAIEELSGIEDRGEYIWIGATTRWTDIRNSELLKRWAPLLPVVAAEIGGVQIQNRATIGGNIVNASPAADGLVALHIHDVEIVANSENGIRSVPIRDFVKGPRKTDLRPGELLSGIHLPKAEARGRRIAFFEKVGSRKAQTITKGSVAFQAWWKDGRLSEVRVALGAVGPTIIRATDAERSLEDDCGPDGLKRASELVSAASRPIDDIRSTARYRRALVGGLLLRGLLNVDSSFAADFRL